MQTKLCGFYSNNRLAIKKWLAFLSTEMCWFMFLNDNLDQKWPIIYLRCDKVDVRSIFILIWTVVAFNVWILCLRLKRAFY